MVFGNGVKNIQAAAYNGARTVSKYIFKFHQYIHTLTKNLLKHDFPEEPQHSLL